MNNLFQMTIISKTMGKNHLEEMEQPSQSTKESEMQYLDAISKKQNDLCWFPKQTFSISGWGIDLGYTGVEWFALEMNQNHSFVFEIAPKNCILDSC